MENNKYKIKNSDILRCERHVTTQHHIPVAPSPQYHSWQKLKSSKIHCLQFGNFIFQPSETCTTSKIVHVYPSEKLTQLFNFYLFWSHRNECAWQGKWRHNKA